MGIVRSREEQLEALKKASSAFASIAFSSAYCSQLDPEFKDIIDFEEFNDVFKKLSLWSVEFENKLIEVELKKTLISRLV
jgi:hypothetical protein